MRSDRFETKAREHATPSLIVSREDDFFRIVIFSSMSAKWLSNRERPGELVEIAKVERKVRQYVALYLCICTIMRRIMGSKGNRERKSCKAVRQ